jgi:hypothetical protein
MTEPSWYAVRGRESLSPPSLPAYPPAVSSVPRAAGIGLVIPPREADCTGLRPSWYPFQINVCDWEFDPVDPPLTRRQMTTEPESV